MVDINNEQKNFLEYVQNYDLNNENIKRKEQHSLRVMAISKKIAEELKLSEEEIKLATLIGLLHDIGRFEQYTKWKTFSDRISTNHGVLGSKILEENNFIRTFVTENKYDEIIKKAIINHNKYQIDENLNETLEQVFRNIEESAKGSESESDFEGLFDDYDVNNNKLGSTVAKRNEKLVKLLNGVGEMNLGDVKEHSIDTFGDAYEYLMTMYASNAGKSGGEFFTPADVSELLTRLGTVGKTEINKVYDPACGSGSLLLKAEKVLGKEAIRNGFYGQEINITTYNLCRINMFLHDIEFDKFNIACEDTLTSPQHWDDEPFELIVSNPPYSIKWAGKDDSLLINDPRFAPAGVLAPKGKADMAFIMHSLSWLAANGTAAIVCFPGIMYRGGAEQKIRKYLVENNYVDCIIQLPGNLFFGTSIATCIMVMKKNKTDNDVLFIDATKECIKVTNNNKLTEENIDRIVSVFTKREEVKHLAYVAACEEIAENDYNLSVSTYVEPEDTREKIDIVKLNAEIKEIVVREQVLRDEIDKIIAEIEVDA